MHTDGRFSWQQMGRPDYAVVAGMVYSLPPEIRQTLNASQVGVLNQVLYLCWYHASHSGRGAAYAIPSEAYLAKAIGRSIRTVQRCLVALRDAGLLEITWRKPIGNKWLTNLYGIGKRMLAVIYASAGKKLQRNQRATLPADNNLKKGIEDATVTGASSNSPTGREKLQALLDGFSASRPKPSAQEEKKEESADISRRELLKKQFEQLKARGL